MAKIIIDLEKPLEEYVNTYINIGGYDVKKGESLYCYPDNLVRAIKNGIVLSGKVTNGDVIKALFGGRIFRDLWNIEGEECIGVIPYNSQNTQNHDIVCDKSWWNAPYKEIERDQ